MDWLAILLWAFATIGFIVTIVLVAFFMWAMLTVDETDTDFMGLEDGRH